MILDCELFILIYIKYKKFIELHTDKIFHIHTRHKDIDDVLSINIKNFMTQAFEPEENILYYNVEKNKLEEIL